MKLQLSIVNALLTVLLAFTPKKKKVIYQKKHCNWKKESCFKPWRTSKSPSTSSNPSIQPSTTPYLFTDDNIYIAADEWTLNSVDAEAKYGHIQDWDVSRITLMQLLFCADEELMCMQSPEFNADISKWDVSRVTNMQFMFAGSNFNQDISGWSISSVTNFFSMFGHVEEFNQNMCSWSATRDTESDVRAMFYGSGCEHDEPTDTTFCYPC